MKLLESLKRYFVWPPFFLRRMAMEEPPRLEPEFPPFRPAELATLAPEPENTPAAFPAPEEPEPEEPEAPRKDRKKHDHTYHYLRKDLGAALEYVLDRLDGLRAARYSKGEFSLGQIDFLENLWGCDFLLMVKGLGERMKGGDKWSVIDGVSPNEIAETVWPIDYAFVTPYDDGDIALYRYETVNMKQVRGRVKVVAKKLLRVTHVMINIDGDWNAGQTILGLVNNQWVEAADPDWVSKGFRRAHRELANFFLPAIFTARYEWHVAFGTIAGGPRILLPTNPGGAVQLFRNRETAPGKNRRDKLKHWVNEHYRDNESDLAYVCHHLRGATEFKWNEYDCELFVSAYDLEKSEFFRKQAHAWRAQRKHNRVRVHLKTRGH